MRLTFRLACASICALVYLCLGLDTAQAQFTVKWLTVGEFGHLYSEATARAEETVGLSWPMDVLNAHNIRAKTIWVGVENFTDENGQNWAAKVAHVGPRVNGANEVFPQLHESINKFEPPTVTVDGFDSFNKVNWSAEQNVVLDPTLPADRAIHTIANYVTGIQFEMTAYAWGNEYNDSYHIQEYVFTNTGNTDDDPDQELNATLNNVWFNFNSRYAPGAEAAAWTNGGGQMWGNGTMQDATWEGNPNYDVDFRSVFAWFGKSSGQTVWNTIGGPIIESVDPWAAASDTVGRLGAALMVGKVIIHADGAAHDPGVEGTDDPNQPFTIAHTDADGQYVDGNATHLNDARNIQEMLIVKEGRVLPTHARAVHPGGDFENQSVDPSSVDGSSSVGDSYGPYTMAIGQQVKIVTAEAVAGLNKKIALSVGRAYKRSNHNDQLAIPYTINGQVVSMTKNQWALTARDSLFQEFEKAIANYESGYAIAEAPLPPSSFSVTGEGERILLEWTVYDNANHTGFEIYRAPNRVDSTSYTLIATLDAAARTYSDVSAIRGTNYYYYIQSVGQVNNNGTAGTPTGIPLKSNRFYTQTYDPATLKRVPGTSLSAVRIVPNPWVISQAESDVRFIGDQLAFYDLPAQCSIKIFTENGELVKTIEHTDNTGDEFWALTSDSNQLIVSGIYLAHFRDNETGQSLVRKFVVIR